ncbi:meiotic recombination protein REC8 homolog [Suncus etruscus]|uniref:meiotic recombination protein REC8 homolog n=1 Tax=Suncus etruscus TaxID=109475 RepID=UPI002110BC21|nr:meiotic recombination protein REC8 homolog [Suncus etruscus]
MFYYPNVLQRHTGCFATIWLAATRGSRLLKREYLNVNVVKTCEDIISYVLVRVPPPMPGLPRPRFSLYLSAQLQIGVIRVYSQQCQYLVEDIQHVLERLHRVQQQILIDMVEPDVANLLPDCLTMMDTLEAAPDPFFGIMSADPGLPSPLNIPQIRHLLEAATPERLLQESPPAIAVEPRRPDKSLITLKSLEAITIQEDEPIRMLQIEGEQDLPEVSRQDLDLLIAEENEAILLEEQKRGLLELPHASPVLEAETPPIQGLDVEELKLAGWKAGTPLPEVTPPKKLSLPSPPILERKPPIFPSPPSPPTITHRRRRRQLLFWDKETQISREKFQEQLQTKAHCWEYPLVQPPKKIIMNPMELFSTPTYPGQLPPELLAFWTRCAQPPPRALRRRAAEETAEERRKMDTPSDIEVLREAQEPSGALMLSSEVSLEAEEDKSRASLVPLEERWAWAEVEQQQLEPPALSVVPELPEVPMELPLEPELLSPEAVHRAVALELKANREPDFNSLVEPFSPRRVAARVFYLLLVLSAQQIIHVEQDKPYARLRIHPGPRFY